MKRRGKNCLRCEGREGGGGREGDGGREKGGGRKCLMFGKGGGRRDTCFK